MLFTNLDTITRRTLLERGMPLHYYTEFLFHAATCVRQLSRDTLKLINTVKIPINSYSAADLPDDFNDDLSVGFNVSGRIQNIPKKDSINPLRNKDDDGNFIPYTTTTTDNGLAVYGSNLNWTWFWNANDFGEPTGRRFGVGGGTSVGYKVVKERRQIQFTENIGEGEAVLMYISDGMRADNATQVDTKAWDAVNAFINWQRSPNNANHNSPEARTYYNERRLLRASLNDLTITDLKDIIRRNTHAAIKG